MIGEVLRKMFAASDEPYICHAPIIRGARLARALAFCGRNVAVFAEANTKVACIRAMLPDEVTLSQANLRDVSGIAQALSVLSSHLDAIFFICEDRRLNSGLMISAEELQLLGENAKRRGLASNLINSIADRWIVVPAPDRSIAVSRAPSAYRGTLIHNG